MYEFVEGENLHFAEGVLDIDIVSVRYNKDNTISATLTDVGIENPNHDAMFAFKNIKGYNDKGEFFKNFSIITDGSIWCPMMFSNKTTLYSRPTWRGTMLNKADQTVILEIIKAFLEHRNLI